MNSDTRFMTKACLVHTWNKKRHKNCPKKTTGSPYLKKTLNAEQRGVCAKSQLDYYIEYDAEQ